MDKFNNKKESEMIFQILMKIFDSLEIVGFFNIKLDSEASI